MSAACLPDSSRFQTQSPSVKHWLAPLVVDTPHTATVYRSGAHPSQRACGHSLGKPVTKGDTGGWRVWCRVG